MLKFNDFVGLRSDVKAVRERMARATEYRKFVDETLGKYGVKDVHDLDDEGYTKFMEDLKGYRKKNRLVAEGTLALPGDVLRELKDQSQRVTQAVFDVVGDFHAYLESVDPDVRMVVVPEEDCDVKTTKDLLQRRLLAGFSFGPLMVEVRNKAEWNGEGMVRYCGTVH